MAAQSYTQNSLGKIPNPLDAYSSYSTQFILLAARTTVAIQDFTSSKSAEQQATLSAIENCTYLGAPVVYGPSKNDVFLVIDTRRFSQFSIESVKYDVYVNGLQKGASTSNLAADLEMVVLDSVGVSFANFMQWLMDAQMQTNYDGLVFLLRILFVGHNPDGTTSTVQSETIPMHLNRMDINLDFAKGIYNLQFMPNMNFDVNQYNRFFSIPQSATKFKTDGTSSLSSVILSLQNELNKASSKYYSDVQAIVKDLNQSRPNAVPSTLGRKVQYWITLPGSWNSFKISGSNIGQITEPVFASKAAPASTTASNSSSSTGQIKESYISTHPGAEITKVLDSIFKQCPEIAKLGNFQTQTSSTGGSAALPDGSVTFYKYIVGITSDDQTMLIHVDVVEFQVPNVLTIPQDKNTVSAQDSFYQIKTDANGTAMKIPNDFIEYDYIFTGQNADILNFDMKIQEFQMLLASNLRIGDNVLKGVTDSGTGDVSGTKTQVDKSAELLYTRPFDPLVLPLDSEAAVANFSRYAHELKTQKQSEQEIKQAQQYTKNLTMFYAGSPTIVELTIKGNPLIMQKFNMNDLLKHQTDAQVTGTSAGSGAGAQSIIDYRKDLEQRILQQNGNSFTQATNGTFVATSNLSAKSYAVSPVFVRVNVSGPNVDFRTNEPANNPDAPYAASVLSENFYVVFKVTNNITNGVFTQVLELYAHNIFGDNKITKK